MMHGTLNVKKKPNLFINLSQKPHFFPKRIMLTRIWSWAYFPQTFKMWLICSADICVYKSRRNHI